jgi:nitrite reductase/ring-hydroxylating ferredoxin subunit
MSEFFKVAKASDIKEGGTKLVEADGEEIVLIKFQGEVYAYEEHCPHEEGPLHEGRIEGDELVCPWHDAKFEISTGKRNPDTDWAPRDLKKFEVKLDGDDVFVKV